MKGKPKEIKGQLCLDLDTYEYQVIVTNMENLTCEEVWYWYNKRCNIENKIDELKVGLGIDQTSQHEMQRNISFFPGKMASQYAVVPDEIPKGLFSFGLLRLGI